MDGFKPNSNKNSNRFFKRRSQTIILIFFKICKILKNNYTIKKIQYLKEVWQISITSISSPVKEISDIFGIESTRFEFAKYTRRSTYDKNYKLNDGFKFESSIDELNEFINGAQ
ncbi:MAG: DUF4476 domain-containing protein [Bacteroidales bacterium]